MYILKKIIPALFLQIALSTQLVAQDQLYKGVYRLDGGISYSSSSQDLSGSNLKRASFSFNPSFSYFVTDKFEIGGTIAYGSTTTTLTYNIVPTGSSTAEKYTATSVGVGPLFRGYLMSGTIYPFIEISYLYSSNSLKYDTNGSSGYTQDESSIYISLGADFFISNAAALEPSIRYTTYSGTTGTTMISAGIGVNFFVK